MTTLVVNETFGPTFQGEGPSAGRLAMFLRLAGCNLACSWCDTPWTWDASRYDLRAESTRVDIDDLLSTLWWPGALLVITGGEPLLQAGGIADYLDRDGRDVEIETNGTLPPPLWAGIGWNVSPKLAHSGRPSVLHDGWRDVPSARFKFVVRSLTDLEAVAAFGLPDDQTWIMPEGTTTEDTLRVAREVAAEVASNGWNLTLRQQVLLWGSERGR